MTITITRDDIQAGKRGDPYLCAAARAISRALSVPVEVWSHMVVVLARDGRYWVPLPRDLQLWIVRYDFGKVKKATAPSYTFELDLAKGERLVDTGLDDTSVAYERQAVLRVAI